MFASDLLAGKVALVTGGGTGIGFGIATSLAQAGASVAIASRRPEHLELAVAELRRVAPNALAVAANVAVLSVYLQPEFALNWTMLGSSAVASGLCLGLLNWLSTGWN